MSTHTTPNDHLISDHQNIHAVHHLIEKCLLFYMDRDECVACLQKHANLKPAITRIVWDELEKSNVEFFAAYAARRMELHELGGTHNQYTASPSPSTFIEDTENQLVHTPSILLKSRAQQSPKVESRASERTA